MRYSVLAVALLALAGCGSEPASENVAANVTAKPTPPPSVVFGGVDLLKPVRAFGTEPYWILDVQPGTIEYQDFSTEKQEPQPFYYVPPVVADGRATWITKNVAGEPVVLTLIAERCLEAGEEEDSQPLTAELKIGTKRLRGCAGVRTYGPPEGGNASDNVSENASAP